MPVTTLDELLSTAQTYRRIIVLGPQRSGTNFAADVLAEETGNPLFSERAFGQTSCTLDATVSRQEPLETFLSREASYVLQAPVLTCTCHTLTIPHALICFMDRSADEIEASRKKSDWPGEMREREKYAATHPHYCTGDTHQRLGDLQLHVWRAYQRERMHMPFLEVPFSLLAEHRRWVPPELRTHFKIGQTRPQ